MDLQEELLQLDLEISEIELTETRFIEKMKVLNILRNTKDSLEAKHQQTMI